MKNLQQSGVNTTSADTAAQNDGELKTQEEILLETPLKDQSLN